MTDKYSLYSGEEWVNISCMLRATDDISVGNNPITDQWLLKGVRGSSACWQIAVAKCASHANQLIRKGEQRDTTSDHTGAQMNGAREEGEYRASEYTVMRRK